MVGLILAKAHSKRLPNKNSLDFFGVPMYVVNLRKCLEVFDKVYVSSDSREILKRVKLEGGIPIMRSRKLCGNTPNIPVYQHAMLIMQDDFIAVQANSPTIDIKIIKTAKELLNDYDEVMTCYSNYTIYGSVWGIKRKKLLGYTNCYNPKPDVLIIDDSIDIHTEVDYELAKKQYEKNINNCGNRS